jgi:transposase
VHCGHRWYRRRGPLARGGVAVDDKSLYAAILGVPQPWSVEQVELRLADGEVHIWVALPKDTLWVCPECHAAAPIHDHRERVWRHLDTCQYRTLVHARVPRLTCPTHGTRQVRVPWADEGGRFTGLFEALAIDWMKHAAIAVVAERLRLSWDEAAGIQTRAVQRGLRRRQAQPARHLGIDETAFARRHQYVSVVTDLDESRVLYVADDRRADSLDAFWAHLSAAELATIEAVAMDMWEPYIGSTRAHLPDADQKIVFDKFHIAQHANDAVDAVRRTENRALLAAGYDWLVGTKFDWLRHPQRFALGAWREFVGFVRQTKLKTGRAWALKEMLMTVWDYVYPGAAERHFDAWYAWAIRSRLEPVKRVARMLRRHWPNIKTYFTARITNAGAESMNSKIQKLKVLARGFRNRERFKAAIYFHLGGLDLYPESLRQSA